MAAHCAIIGCQQLAAHGKKTCDLQEHNEVERIHNERGQARFQLQERLRRAKIAHPTDAIGILSHYLSRKKILTMGFMAGEVVSGNSDVADMDDDEEEFSVINGLDLPARSDAATSGSLPMRRNQLRAQFGRKRTHNEQIIVAPCGIILARETFYGAEAVPTVVVSNLFHSVFSQ